MKFILFFLYLSFSFAGSITDQQKNTLCKICSINNNSQIELNDCLKDYCDNVCNNNIEIIASNKLETDSANLLYNPITGKISNEKNSNITFMYDSISREPLINKNQNEKYIQSKKKWFRSIGFGPSLTNNTIKPKVISDNSNIAINFGLYRN